MSTLGKPTPPSIVIQSNPTPLLPVVEINPGIIKTSSQHSPITPHISSSKSNLLSLRLLAANCGVQTPINKSSHSSSSCESNSTSSSSLTLPISTGGGANPELLLLPPPLLATSPSLSQLALRQTRLVSKINFPTLYRCPSSSALTYFHPSTLPHCAQLISPTVCAPVTSCLGTGLCVYVLGRLGRASFFALAVRRL